MASRDPQIVEDGERGTGLSADTPPWLQPVNEEEDLPPGGTRVYILAGAAITIVLVFAAVIFFLYSSSDEAPVYVKGPDAPVRERPADRGGLEVPHQDKQVFDRAAGNKVAVDAPIVSPAETPVEGLDEMAAAAEEAFNEAREEQPFETAFEASQDEGEEKPDTAPVAAQDKTAVNRAAAQVEAQAEAQVAAPVPVDAYRVQLGAFGSEAGAERSWKALKGKFRTEFGDLSAQFEPVKTSDRTLYRLRVGPLDTRALADKLCLALKAKEQACIVVNP